MPPERPAAPALANRRGFRDDPTRPSYAPAGCVKYIVPFIGPGYEYLHVCVDDYSRVAYVELLPDARGATAAGFLERAAHRFASREVTIERVLTDNGSGYLSNDFRDRCRQLQITHTRTRPRRPQTNGKAERFIQTLLREWAYARTYTTSNERLNAADVDQPLQLPQTTRQPPATCDATEQRV